MWPGVQKGQAWVLRAAQQLWNNILIPLTGVFAGFVPSALPALGAAHIHTWAVVVGVTQRTNTALEVPNLDKTGLFKCVFHTSAQGPSQVVGFETNPKGMVCSLCFLFGEGVPTASGAACPGWSLWSW